MKLGPIMLSIFKPKGTDWLGVRSTKHNPFTYHHIFKAVYGGEVSVDNGAILTDSAHKWLHYLEHHNLPLYIELNRCFAELNATKAPPTLEYYQRVSSVLKRYGKGENYERTLRVSLYERGTKRGK